MGRMKENPRYIVISFRVSDKEKDRLNKMLDRHKIGTMSDMCLGTMMAACDRDEERHNG